MPIVIEHPDDTIITYLSTDDCIHRLQQLIECELEVTQDTLQRWVDIVIQEHLDIVYRDVYDDYNGFVNVSITQENRNELDMITLEDLHPEDKKILRNNEGVSIMKKVIRDGEVAVLISSDFGGTWSFYSEDNAEALLFDPRIVKLVEERAKRLLTTELFIEKVKTVLDAYYPDEYITPSTITALEIEWVDEGTRFIIQEYDGIESLHTENDLAWRTA